MCDLRIVGSRVPYSSKCPNSCWFYPCASSQYSCESPNSSEEGKGETVRSTHSTKNTLLYFELYTCVWNTILKRVWFTRLAETLNPFTLTAQMIHKIIMAFIYISMSCDQSHDHPTLPCPKTMQIEWNVQCLHLHEISSWECLRNHCAKTSKVNTVTFSHAHMTVTPLHTTVKPV